MFSEEFNKMVIDPARIRDIPQGDIRVIAERYPYCQSAQILLARKLHISQSPLFDQQLRKTAIMAFDREQLYHFIHQPLEVSVLADNDTDESPVLQEPVRLHVVEEEVPVEAMPEQKAEPEIPVPETEVTPVHEAEAEAILQEMIESIPEITHQQQDVDRETENPLAERQSEDISQDEIAAETLLREETLSENLEHAAEPEEEVAQDMTFTAFPDEQPDFDRELVFDLPPYDIERELGSLQEADKFTLPNIPPEVAAEENTEVYTDTFTGWLNRLGGTPTGKVVEQKASNAPVKVYLRKKTAPGENPASGTADRLMNEQFAAELARKSIQIDEGVVSETYARILVMQGKYVKAIEMYNRLSLLKPQKSDYFAALIDQIKKKIK